MPRPCLPHQKPCYLCGHPVEFARGVCVEPGRLAIEVGGEGERDEVIMDDGSPLVGALRHGCDGYIQTARGLRLTTGRHLYSRHCPSPLNKGRHRKDYLGPRVWSSRKKDKQLNLLGE